MSNTTVPTKPFTTINLYNVIKQTRKLIILGLKSRRVNYALIYSNVQIAKVNIKLIQLTVLFGNIGSIRNGILKNIPRFEKIAINQFVLL